MLFGILRPRKGGIAPLTRKTESPKVTKPEIKRSIPTSDVNLALAPSETVANMAVRMYMSDADTAAVKDLVKGLNTRADVLAALEDENWHPMYRRLQDEWHVPESDVTAALHRRHDDIAAGRIANPNEPYASQVTVVKTDRTGFEHGVREQYGHPETERHYVLKDQEVKYRKMREDSIWFK